MSIPCKMNPLGSGRGGERFPLGYKRLEFLESTGTQRIETGVKIKDICGRIVMQSRQPNNNIGASVYNTSVDQSRLKFEYTYWNPTSRYRALLQFNSEGFENPYLNGEPIITIIDLPNKKMQINDSQKNLASGEYANNNNLLTLFAHCVVNNNSTYGGVQYYRKGRIMQATFSNAGVPTANFIPALDPSGRPCMFDTITRKPFYNQGTGEFIAGMTAKQARHLAYLPSTGGSLTISLPLAAAFDEKVQNALTTASEKGWVFTFYWTEVTEYLTPRIDAIVGAGNYTISYDYTAQKVSLSITFPVSESQIEEVKGLLDHELLRNIVTEIEYYKQLQWLYAAIGPYIDTGIIHGADVGMIYEVERTFISDSYLTGVVAADGQKSSNPARYVPGLSFTGSYPGTYLNWGWCPSDLPLAKTVHSLNFLNDKKLELKNEYLSKESNLNAMTEGLTWNSWTLFTLHVPISQWSGRGRIYWAKFSRDNEIIAHFVPALDPTGAPCMFDTVSKIPFYNDGTGDFLYPGAEQAVQTLDLDWDAKSYAKLTEHGVRRLYHVPEGYTGTKDEYAAENGFKELVEPPVPLEGYWMPEWCETETQLICEWVETEPPTESLAESLEES